MGLALLVGCSNSSPASSSGKITKADFESLEVGMTIEDVFALIGEGELSVESGTVGEELHTAAYTYDGKGSLGANVQLMFQGGKLITKAQAGLK
ncbi:hypothetical protein BK133_11105 [Paenibacillus sp. FSL H8-0548]|nr:hypothetical protein BK133_11105 [Paenibacillus sp. FSL H8-0548]